MSILGLGVLLLQVQLAAANGTVTKPGGSEPLPKATVMLTPVTPGQVATQRSAVTEDDGRFEVRDLVPGDYRLTVLHARYGQAAFGQRKPGGPGTILSIAPGQRLSDLRISMIPTGAIAGRITGLNGEPLVNAAVRAFKYAYQDGKKVLTVAQSTNTDDRGEYRLYWLPAGQYLVADAAAGNTAAGPSAAQSIHPGSDPSGSPLARAELELAAMLRNEAYPAGNTRLRILEDGSTQEEAWVTVFYPTSKEPRLATAINLSAGTTVTGINIPVGPARVQRVSGHVVGFRSGSTSTVTLIPLDTTSGLQVPLAGHGASNVDGSFAFTGVLPGEYLAVARDTRSGLVASPVPVHVGDGDVESLIVGMTQAISVAGRIVIEGIATDAGSANPLAGISIGLRQNDLLQISDPVALQVDAKTGEFVLNPQVDAKTGTFVLNNLAPGDYQIQVATSGAAGVRRLYVKSARLGLTDVAAGVHIADNTNDRLEIVLTPNAGSVEGVAIGGRGGPAANMTVVLVPNVARKRSDLYRAVVTGSDGRFRFPDLTPGEYKLFAWDDVETGAWQDPDFMRSYESKGLLVHVAEKGKEDVQLNVIYSP